MFPEPKAPDIPIVQVELSRGYERLTTWVDKKPKLQVGAKIRLKDFQPDVYWLVEKVYSNVHNAKDFDWHRKWDNNI